MRTSLTLVPLGLAVLLVGFAMVSPIAADEIVTNVTGVAPSYTLRTGDKAPLFSAVKFYHGYKWGGWGYPNYRGYYYGYPYGYNYYGDGYGYYRKGNQVCVFSGYGYRCYPPGGTFYY